MEGCGMQKVDLSQAYVDPANNDTIVWMVEF